MTNRPTVRTPQYLAGFSAGWDGPNMDNCHFKHFATPAMRDDWERGKRDADKARKEAV